MAARLFGDFTVLALEEGLCFADSCLDFIEDEETRNIVKTFLFAAITGGGSGALSGATVVGPAGAAVGGIIGVTVDYFAAHYTISVRKTGGRIFLMPSLV